MNVPCEGSNQEPLFAGPGSFEIPAGTIDVAGAPTPFRRAYHVAAGEGVCGHCFDTPRVLRNATLAKHMTWKSWK